MIEPEEAVRFAARTLVDQLSVFADLKGTAVEVEELRAADRSDPVASGR